MTSTNPPAGRAPVWPAVVTVVALGSLPYLNLLAANVGESVQLGTVALWWVTTVGVGLAVVGVASRFGRRPARWAGALTGVALYLVFNYPAITGLRESLGVPMSPVWWWALLAVLVMAVAVPITATAVGQRFVAILAPLLLLSPIVQLVTADPVEEGPAVAATAEDLPELVHRPNVYWFVLDGFAGPPFLREEVGVDPDPFLAHLRDHGFDVQEQARANYPLTHLSVPSTLAMEYLYEGVEEPTAGPFFEALRGDNRTVDTFLANDYRYVHAYPGLWTGSRCGGREHVCIGDHGLLTDTEWALASATPLIEVVGGDETDHDIARGTNPVQVIDRVLQAAPASPYYAFVHLINPHPPFLRDADCEVRDVSLSLSEWGSGPEYGEAATCLMRQLAEAVDRILAVDDDPVIVIQGDHGPRLGLDGSTTGRVPLEGEMFSSAFSAIRLPQECQDRDVPDDLTLVNTWRVVFACLADRPPDLLPDRIFPIVRDYGH